MILRMNHIIPEKITRILGFSAARRNLSRKGLLQGISGLTKHNVANGPQVLEELLNPEASVDEHLVSASFTYSSVDRLYKVSLYNSQP
jgi:hypothetical protein